MNVYIFWEKHKWIVIVGILACIIIAILRFTSWRPLGYCLCADSVNFILETISFSLLAAIIFWFVNDYRQYIRCSDVAVNHIERRIWTIRELVRQMINSIEPFKLGPKKYTMESFTKAFNQKDLYDGYYGNPQKTIVDAFNENKNIIETMAESLLASYSDYMTKIELRSLNELLNSQFIRDNISPINFSIPEDVRHCAPSNQEEIGKSLYKLAQIKWTVSSKWPLWA